jgi:hypothetical protein
VSMEEGLAWPDLPRLVDTVHLRGAWFVMKGRHPATESRDRLATVSTAMARTRDYPSGPKTDRLLGRSLIIEACWRCSSAEKALAQALALLSHMLMNGFFFVIRSSTGGVLGWCDAIRGDRLAASS